jgi:hypothetical protein
MGDSTHSRETLYKTAIDRFGAPLVLWRTQKQTGGSRSDGRFGLFGWPVATVNPPAPDTPVAAVGNVVGECWTGITG